MKTKFALFLVSMLLTSGWLMAQTPSKCGTKRIDSLTAMSMRYYGNNQYLLNLVDSIEGGGSTSRYPANNIFCIPVTAWVWTNGSGNLIDDYKVEQYINYVNDFYKANHVGIKFYLRCQINRNVNTTWYNNVQESNYNTMFDNNRVANTMNVHFVYSPADGYNRGRFPWESNPYAAYVSTYGVYYEDGANSLAHELGHALGLLHTHENARGWSAANNALATACYQESVNRSRVQGVECLLTYNGTKCSLNGDMLCDTDADPLLLRDGVSYVDGNCNYNRAIVTDPTYLTDKWGDQWLPAGNNNATRNMMAYTTKACRTQITTMQKGVLYLWTLFKGGYVSNPSYFQKNAHVDDYENDNFVQNAKPITAGEIQERTLHAVPDQNGIMTTCDVDWVKFVPTCSGTYVFETSRSAFSSDANTRLTLYNSALTSLMQNDDITFGINFFSRVYANLTAGQTYYLKVENAGSNAGYYKLTATTGNISGPATMCSSGVYTMQNLPTGATVSWTASPTGLVTITPISNGTTAVVNRVGNPGTGTVTLTATVTSSCGTYAAVPMPVIYGQLENSGITGPSSVCNYEQMTFRISPTPPGGASFNWSWPSEWGYVSGQGADFLIVQASYANPPGKVSCTVTSQCGVATPQLWVVVNQCLTFKVSPIPANNQITVTAEGAGDTKQKAIGAVNYEVRLYDLNNQLVRTVKNNNARQVNVDVRGLKAGQYVIQILNGKDKTTQHVMINH